MIRLPNSLELTGIPPNIFEIKSRPSNLDLAVNRPM